MASKYLYVCMTFVSFSQMQADIYSSWWSYIQVLRLEELKQSRPRLTLGIRFFMSLRVALSKAGGGARIPIQGGVGN